MKATLFLNTYGFGSIVKKNFQILSCNEDGDTMISEGLDGNEKEKEKCATAHH